LNKRILVLDDSQDILDIVREVLAYEGFEVTCISEAARLDDAISILKPDLILLDYMLIDGNGADICSKLKAAETTRDIPVIIFSAYINKNEDFTALNCDAVLPKPFDIKTLVETINRVLGTI
jgi:DNA-binding response OmpR family regulator